MFIQLCRTLIHHLLRELGRALRRSRRSVFDFLIRMIIDKQLLDGTRTDRSLVHLKGGSELTVRSDLDLLQETRGEMLTVVVDEIIGWSFFSHVEDRHLSCERLSGLGKGG